MALERDKLNELAAKLMANTITDEEQVIFNEWINEQMQKDAYEIDAGYALDEEEIKLRIKGKLLDRIAGDRQERTKSAHSIPLWKRWLPVAASIALICGLGYFSISKFYMSKPAVVIADIAPGYNKAVIQFSDGQVAQLSDKQTGVKITGNDVSYFDGTDAVAHKEPKDVKPGAENTIITPKGGQYQVMLPDGTQVWLNANSKLKYPVVFAGNKRQVTLEGEAYFEVKKHHSPDGKHLPFIVKSKQQEVKVMGTGFNVYAYSDDPYTKTSLLHGHVKVQSYYQGKAKELDLMPGQETLASKSEFQVRNADVEAAASWRTGYFNFENKPIKQVLKEIERWYDIEVVYEGAIPEVEFYGGIYRSNKLSAVIKVLQSSGIDAHLEKDRVLIVKKANQ